MLITIKVTQEHINKGTTNCKTCPVALALNEIIKDKYTVRAYVNAILIGDLIQPVLNRFPPREVTNFIRSYDRLEPVEPFEFELDIPEELLKC